MATVTLNIPSDKVQFFLAMVMENGFNQPSNYIKSKVNQLQRFVQQQDRRNMHPYYDWEFFHNELEYE
jgi:hypothetical protein